MLPKQNRFQFLSPDVYSEHKQYNKEPDSVGNLINFMLFI